MSSATLRIFLLSAVLVAGFGASASAAEQGKKIVLIGGPKSHGVGQHDFYHGVAAIKALLEASPEFKRQPNVVMDSSFRWPPNAKSLEGAATLVMYFDGADIHPLLDDAKRAQFERLMAQGVGLVMLHQAFTVPADNTSIDLIKSLGGARYGLHDRVESLVDLQVNSPKHPVSRGVGAISYQDEFYPTVRFAKAGGRLTPILSGEMTPTGGEAVKGRQQPRNAVAAWAFDRAGGGRSFAFSGAHFISALDKPEIRKMLLNAIFWTAGMEMPAGGVTTTADDKFATKLAFPGLGRAPIAKAVVVPKSDIQVLPQEWGKLEWYVSGPRGSSDTMTTGLATIAVGKANPRHFHPGCDEVLHVLKGRIRHTMNDVTVEMGPGDTVSIPQGVWHNAANIGDVDAELAISFSSAWREVVGE